MKKIFLFVAVIAVIAIAAQTTYGQTGIRITVHGELIAGNLSGGSSPLCYGTDGDTINGTLPTGGNGNYTYQWQSSIDGGGSWDDILNATSQNYATGILYVSTDFRRMDIDSCGFVYTDTISIVVYNEFLSGTISGGTSPICYHDDGGILTSTTPSGGAPGTTYQWQKWNTAGAWEDIIGEIGSTYTVDTLSATSTFRVAYINPSCGTLYSNQMIITVYMPFTQGTISGGEGAICYNTGAGVLTSTAPSGGAPGTTLQWESSSDGMMYAPIINQTALTLILGNLTQSTWYRLRYNNICDTLFSNIIPITVYDDFIAGTILLVGDDTICHATDPGNITGTVANGGAPGTTYQWQSSVDGGTSWDNLTGEVMTNFNIPTLTQTTKFRRRDVNSCGTLHTNTITIYVYLAFNPGIIGVAQAICYGEQPMQLANITAPSGGSGTYTYQWEESNDGGVSDPWIDVVGETNATFQPPNLTSGIWYRRIVTDIAGCGTAPSLP